MTRSYLNITGNLSHIVSYRITPDIANVLTYVRNSFGNSGDAVSFSEVRRIRSEAPPPVNPADKFE